MKYLLTGVLAAGVFFLARAAFAWEGFDAETADLVEILTDIVPAPGAKVDVRAYDTDSTQTCIVESVTRNRRTIEVVVKDPNGARRTLVMEMR